jgi:hypothetical protein
MKNYKPMVLVPLKDLSNPEIVKQTFFLRKQLESLVDFRFVNS